MKNLILKTNFVVLMLFVAFNFSCSPEDGADGAQGPAGTNGIDGAVGPAGTNGVDGEDGEDGNANVQVLTKDISAATGTFSDVAVAELTQSVIDNDVVLGYVKRSGNSSWYPLPAIGDILPFSIAVYLSSGFYSLDFVDRVDGSAYTIADGYLDVLKIVIIKSTSTTTGKGGNQQKTLESLNEAGVDLNDYYAVCDYFGIAY